MQHELANVAMDRPGEAIAEAILSMNKFDHGVPADDASCENLINFLHWVADGEEGDPRRRAMARTTFENGVEFDAHDRVPIKICAEFDMTIAFVESGHLTTDKPLPSRVPTVQRGRWFPWPLRFRKTRTADARRAA